ncbi:MAG: sulfotransferase [Planctomycetota bacterium]
MTTSPGVLPNFLIIGAAKCATTSIYHQLSQHPDVCVPGGSMAEKEPAFFSQQNAGTWDNGLDWYKSLFQHWDGEKAVGEASTSYTKTPAYSDPPELIQQVIPDARLIYIIRNPLDQILSHYRHIVLYGDADATFAHSIFEGDFLISVASYYRQIQAYMSRFEREQLLVILFEDYVRATHEYGVRLCEFLEIDATIPLEGEPRNVSRSKRYEKVRGAHRFIAKAPRGIARLASELLTRPVSSIRWTPETHAYAAEQLAPDIAALRDFLGDDLDRWNLSYRG